GSVAREQGRAARLRGEQPDDPHATHAVLEEAADVVPGTGSMVLVDQRARLVAEAVTGAQEPDECDVVRIIGWARVHEAAARQQRTAPERHVRPHAAHAAVK